MEPATDSLTSPPPTRRRFYLTFIYGLWGAISAALAAPALLYLFLPPKSRAESDWVEAGDVTGLQPKTPVELVFRKNRVDGWKVSSEKQTAWVPTRSTTEWSNVGALLSGHRSYFGADRLSG